MKFIQKGSEPPEFAAFRDECAASANVPKWKDLPGPVAEVLRRGLFTEQGAICCYCGRRLVANDNHIEHLVPRDGTMGNPSLTFVWTNLLACCQANLQRGDPRHCSVKKDNWYDATLMVSPLDSTCERRFRFELDGRMGPTRDDDLGAKETICKLDLDGARLRGLRKGAIEGLFDQLDDDMHPEDYEKLAGVYQERDSTGNYEAFCFIRVAALMFFTT